MACLIISCAGKKENSSTVKLNLSALLASGSISMNGGVIIMGHSLDDSEEIFLGVPNGAFDHILELKKGRWEFGVVGWIGSVPMTSTVRCGYSGVVDINSDNFDVKLNLARGVCKGFNAYDEAIIFSDPSFLDNDAVGDINQFKKIDVRSCLVVNPSGGCTDPSGLTQSYRFLVEGSQRKGNVKTALPGLISGCIASGSAITDANGIRLPVGNSVENFLDYKILAYTTSDCTGDTLVFPFRERSPVMGLNGNSIKSSIIAESFISAIYIEHNPNTVNEFINNNASYFGFGRDGDVIASNFAPNFIISANDYAKIIEIPNGDTFKLATTTSNINLYDEVMWYVNGEAAANACGASVNKLVTGMFGHGYVKSKTVSTDTVITLDKSLSSYRLENGNIISVELPSPVSLSGNCSMQIIKVRDFRNVFFPSTVGAKILPTPFTSGTGKGGIIAMKVNGVIKQNADGQGFDSSGQGLDFLPVYDNCYSVGKRCMGMGNTNIDGINGGGLIQVQAQNLDVDPAGAFKFSSSGHYIPKWLQVSIATSFGCGLEVSGKIYCFGENPVGQLGDSTTTSRGMPTTAISTAQTFVKVKTAMDSACAITSTGGVYCWGGNAFGQLGQGNLTDSNTPLQVAGLVNITDIVAGRSFFCALKSDNTLYCWGRNDSGQFGNGTMTDSLTPTLTVSSALKVFAGGYHMCMIDTSNNLKCWGQNAYGQLGDGTTTLRNTPVTIGGFTGVQTLHLGDLFTCALKADGNVWCWGKGADGQIGNNTLASINSTPLQTNNITNITDLFGGSYHVCSKDGSDNYHCWGKNDQGSVTGAGVQVPEPRAVSFSGLNGRLPQKINSDAGLSYTSCLILSGGAMKCWGKTTSSGTSLIGETSIADTFKDTPVWSGLNGLAKAGHINLAMKNILGNNTKLISIINRDQSNNTSVLDGPIHFRFCQKPNYVTVQPDFITAPSYTAVEANLCF